MVAVIVIATTVSTSFAAVTLTRVTPAAVRPGQTVKLSCRGSDLADARTLWTSFPSQVERIPGSGDQSGQVIFAVTLSKEVRLGLGAIRVVTARGISNLRPVVIDDLPDPGKRSTGLLPLFSATDGTAVAGKPNRYRVRLTAGQRLTVDLWARRLGSQLDPVVRVTDAGGKTMVAVDDSPGLSGDVRLSFEVPHPGDHVITVRDVRGRGGDGYFFRLRLGTFGSFAGTWPLVIRRGTSVDARLLGRSRQDITRTLAIPADHRQPAWWFGVSTDEARGSALVAVRVTRQQQVIETEPNDKPAQATAVPADAGVNGRLERPGDRDWYRVPVRSGQRLRIVGRTASLGMPGRLFLRLCDAAGKTLAEAPQAVPARRVLEYTATADAGLLLRVDELQRRGGPRYAYHLQFGSVRPGFELAAATDRLHASPGGSVSLKVTCTRRDFNGPITLAVAGLGPDVKLAGQVIPAGKKETTLKLTLPAAFKPETTHAFRVEGTATIDQPAAGPVVRELAAVKFDRGNLGIFDGFISDNAGGLNFAEYDVELEKAGEYLVLLKYAAKAARPAVMKLGGKVVKQGIMSQTTGSWEPGTARWFNEGLVRFPAGKSVLRLEKTGVFSHLTTIRIALPAKPGDSPSHIHRTTASTTAILRSNLANIRHVPPNLDGQLILSVTAK